VSYVEEIAQAIRAEVSEDALPDGDATGLFLIYAVLLFARGVDVSREDVHNAWVAWMASQGKTHEAMIPFDELPSATQAEDSPFMLAIRTVAIRRTR
jgi:hypothetical protein